MELALLKTGGGVDTSELTATENDVVSPYTFYGKDDEEKDTGGVTNKGKKTHTLAANGTYAIEEGYYESITVNQSLATYAGATVNPGKNAVVLPTKNKYVTGNVVLNSIKNLVPSNIKKGEYVGGVGPGTWEGYINVDPMTPYYYGTFNEVQSVTPMACIGPRTGYEYDVTMEKDAIFLQSPEIKITSAIYFNEPIDFSDAKKLRLTIASDSTGTYGDSMCYVVIAEKLPPYETYLIKKNDDNAVNPTLGEIYLDHRKNLGISLSELAIDVRDINTRGYLYIGAGYYAEQRIHVVRLTTT